jgi:lipid-A-disaccharide synthase
MAACNAAIAASGTVTLELAMAKVPTIVAYRSTL